MYTAWYATEYFSQHAQFKDWVTGETVQSTNVYDAWMLLVNLSQERDAAVTATFFYRDEPSKDWTFTLPAGQQGRVHMRGDVDNLGTNNLPPGCNPRKRFGVRVRSTVPIVVQATVGDRLPHERVTNSVSTFMYHPGPLGELEKQWYYVDCVYLTRQGVALEGREWLTILNPNKTPAHCTVAFIPGGDVSIGDARAGRSDEAPVEYKLTVPAERILPTDLADLPQVLPNLCCPVRVTGSTVASAIAGKRAQGPGLRDPNGVV